MNETTKIAVFAVNAKYLNKDSKSCFLRLLTKMKIRHEEIPIIFYVLNGKLPPFSIHEGLKIATEEDVSHILFAQSYAVFNDTLYDELESRDYPAVFSPSWGRNIISLRRGTMKYEAALLRTYSCKDAIKRMIDGKIVTMTDVYKHIVESGIEPFITIPPVAELHSFEKVRKDAFNAHANDKLSA